MVSLGRKRTQTMKGKRYPTEEKIRILREADGGRSVQEVCRERNISEQTFCRWKRQFGMMEVDEARKLKELERENGELKKNRGRPPTDREQRLLQRMKELSEKEPRDGYRRIVALLREEGWAAGKRHIQRLRRAAGLRVLPTKRKLVRRGVSTGLPTRATHRGHGWTWDFISDATVRGGALRRLTILDEPTRECHVLRADRALRGADVLEWLQRAIEEHGAPGFLRSDKGPEFIAKAVQHWLAEKRIKTIYIDPGSPWQNGFVESSSTGAFAMSASTVSSSGHSPKREWSLKTSATTTTTFGRTAGLATKARLASRRRPEPHPSTRMDNQSQKT